jgi:hypothetical protein
VKLLDPDGYVVEVSWEPRGVNSVPPAGAGPEE